MKISGAIAALLLSAAPVFAQSDAITQDTSVSDIESKDVYGTGGEQLAGVDNVVIGPDKKIYAVIEFGGFLGLGQENRLVPLDEFTLEGDRLILPGRAEGDLKSLQAWDNDLKTYSELEDNYMAPLRVSAKADSAEPTAAPNVRPSEDTKPAEPAIEPKADEPSAPATPPANP